MKRMVKEILVVLVAAVILITLSGCARVNYEVNLNKDGSADVSYVMGYDKEFLNSMGVSQEDLGDGAFDDMKNEATEDGYQIEEYNDEYISGFRASKHFDNISDFKMDEVGDKEISSEDQTNEITFEKAFLNTKVSQNSKIDLKSLNNEDEDSETSSIMNMLLGQMKFSYKITLPFKVGNNNATAVSEDGKTLEWTLTPGDINEVYFEASQNLNIALLVCIVAAVVIVIIVIIVVTKKGKKTSSKREIKITPETIPTTAKQEEEKIEEKVQEDKKEVEAKEEKVKEKKTEKKPSTTKKSTAAKKTTTAKKSTAAKNKKVSTQKKENIKKDE